MLVQKACVVCVLIEVCQDKTRAQLAADLLVERVRKLHAVIELERLFIECIVF